MLLSALVVIPVHIIHHDKMRLAVFKRIISWPKYPFECFITMLVALSLSIYIVIANHVVPRDAN